MMRSGRFVVLFGWRYRKRKVANEGAERVCFTESTLCFAWFRTRVILIDSLVFFPRLVEVGWGVTFVPV